MHRLSRGNPRLITQVCDVALTYGFAEQARVITSKLVAQAAFDRNKGRILPLAAVEELGALAAAPEDPTEIDAALPQPNPPQSRSAFPTLELTAARSVCTPGSLFYAKGVAMKKEGRSREAIDMLEQAGRNPSYLLKAQAQIGLCHRSMGDYGAAIQAFRDALNIPASRQLHIDVRYFLARTLESAGELAEATTLYHHIAQMNPCFRDAGYRAKTLSSRPKSLTSYKRRTARNVSWFGNAIENFNQLIGGRK